MCRRWFQGNNRGRDWDTGTALAETKGSAMTWQTTPRAERETITRQIMRILTREGSRAAFNLSMRVGLDGALVVDALKELEEANQVESKRTDGGLVIWSAK